jgi:hypothetical protein
MNQKFVIAKMATQKSLIDFCEARIGDTIKIEVNVVEYDKPKEQRPTIYVNPNELHVIAQDLVNGHYKEWDKVKAKDNSVLVQYVVRGGNLEKNVARELIIQVKPHTDGQMRVSFIGKEGTAKSVGSGMGAVAIDQVTKQCYTMQKLSEVKKHLLYNMISYNFALATQQYVTAINKGYEHQGYWKVNSWESSGQNDNQQQAM